MARLFAGSLACKTGCSRKGAAERSFFNLKDNSNESYFSMATLLAENPEPMELIPEYLRLYADENDVAARMITGILKYIGTPAAQKTLGSIVEDINQSETSRMRAAVAVNEVKLPTDSTVDTLKKQARLRGNESDDSISNTPYLALGSAAGKLKDGGSDSYDSIRQNMLYNLNLQNIPENMTLPAIGNTGDPQLYGEINRFLYHGDPSVGVMPLLPLYSLTANAS